MKTPRNVSEARYVGGYRAEDRSLLRRCDQSARDGTCVACGQLLEAAEALSGLHQGCARELPRDTELTIRSVVAMRLFELAPEPCMCHTKFTCLAQVHEGGTDASRGNTRGRSRVGR